MAGAGDTIFAVATGAGRSALAVIRVSGGASGSLLGHLCGRTPEPRRATLRWLRDERGEAIDRGLVLWFPGPGSYTGEDQAELQVHGGPAVLAGIAGALVGWGARPAEPGEFTRRAFLNGKLDILEAEGVADLVAAETSAQLRLALEQVSGSQSALVADWAARVLRLLAWQEALIDFPDEGLPPEIERDLVAEIDTLATELESAMAGGAVAAKVREGLVFAVTGAPNVGKSSLVNALAEREVAIVSAVPGTTRDTLEVRLELAGVPVTLVDTAGLRDTADPVEAEGVRRARARVAAADLVLHVVENDGGREPPSGVRVVNKIDLTPMSGRGLGVSARTGEGLEELRAFLAAEAARLAPGLGGAGFGRARHLAALRDAASALAEAREAAMPELRGECLRAARAALSRLAGKADGEAVLDAIFGQFCIGK